LIIMELFDCMKNGQTFALTESHAQILILINTIGASILVETLRDAAYFFTHSSRSLTHHEKIHFRETQSAYAFVTGTGLDIFLSRYYLDYNAQKLRDLFPYYAKER